MDTEEILSAGIDIGTSTTQLIFSKIKLKNIGGFGKIPEIKIVSKDIIYKSDIYFTPLHSADEIDGAAVSKIIQSEYKKAKIAPDDLSTGAVIITGESSRKKNAKEVVEAISEIAGDFVVATAGADLESVLAGKGSGAGLLSENELKHVVNLDIGGGTTNICYFIDGEVADTACLDIGGRLVKISNNKIIYISDKIKKLIAYLNLDIHEGKIASRIELKKLTDLMAEILAESVLISHKGKWLDFIKTNRLLSIESTPDIITFSGGVALCMQSNYASDDWLKFGDIGILLAESISQNPAFEKVRIENALETMRATVIGAGNYSMSISGSTIEYTQNVFPLKSIPVARIKLDCSKDIPFIKEEMHKALRLYDEFINDTNQLIAFSMKGPACPSFNDIDMISSEIVSLYENEFADDAMWIIIIENDIGKALGQALKRKRKSSGNIICLDGIKCTSGDYIDMGEPVANGKVIPVILKTLVFNG